MEGLGSGPQSAPTLLGGLEVVLEPLRASVYLLGIGDASDCLISGSSSRESPRGEQMKRAFEKYKELYSPR